MAIETDLTPHEYLKGWFGYLKQIQTCAKPINNDIPEELTDFARLKPADIFTGGDLYKDQFRQCVQVNTNQYVPDSAFTKGSFLEFLEYVYSPLHGYVLGVVQLVAGDTYVSISPTDFDAKLATEVFPTPTGQQLLVKALNDDMGEEIAGAWFPAAKVNPLLKLISTGGKKVKDVVDFIAKPGGSKS